MGVEVIEGKIEESCLSLKEKGLTVEQLKIIAIVTMFIDHFAAVLFPYFQLSYVHNQSSFFWYQLAITLMRLIGRVAFPIFAFLIVNGFYHTSNRKNYLIRLGVFALVSEPFFDFALFGTWFETTHQNVFFTLALGLLAIWGYDNISRENRRNYIGGLFVACIGFLALNLKTDYDFYGILTIFLIYLFFENFKRMSIALIGLNVVLYAAQLSVWSLIPPFVLRNYGLQLQGGYGLGIQVTFYLLFISQLFSLLALFILKYYNGEKGNSVNKYFFYAFYPVHLFVLGLILYLLQLA